MIGQLCNTCWYEFEKQMNRVPASKHKMSALRIDHFTKPVLMITPDGQTCTKQHSAACLSKAGHGIPAGTDAIAHALLKMMSKAAFNDHEDHTFNTHATCRFINRVKTTYLRVARRATSMLGPMPADAVQPVACQMASRTSLAILRGSPRPVTSSQASSHEMGCTQAVVESRMR